MKIKSGKGLLKLIICISIIVLIGTIIAIYIKNLVKDERIKGIQADLLLVQAKIEIVKGNNSMNKDENPLKGYILNQLPENIDITTFLEKNIISEDEYEKYYLLDSKCLEELDLKNFINKYSGFFLVNYDNFEVIYTEGYQNANGLWCYKLSELNKLPEIQKEDITQNVNTENIATTEITATSESN